MFIHLLSIQLQKEAAIRTERAAAEAKAGKTSGKGSGKKSGPGAGAGGGAGAVRGESTVVSKNALDTGMYLSVRLTPA